MKTFALILTILLLAGPAWSATALYRISSGEVTVISITDNDFSDRMYDAQYSVLSGGTYPDGYDCAGTGYELRVLGTAKIVDSTTVRNATQVEIDTFAGHAADDKNQREEDAAKSYFQNDPKFRRAVIAIIKGIIKEDNELRNWTRDFKDLVAASTSLANFKSRVAAEETLVNRQFEDAKTYILNQISKDD